VRHEPVSKLSAPDEGRRRIFFFKIEGQNKCSTYHKLRITHYDENLNYFGMNLTFKSRLYHILNKHWSQGTEVRPLSFRDITLLENFMCGVHSRDINSSSSKTKQSLITSVMEAFSNIAREAFKRGCSLFKLRLEEAVGAKGNLTREMQSLYPNKQFQKAPIVCCSHPSRYYNCILHQKTGVNTPRTLYISKLRSLASKLWILYALKEASFNAKFITVHQNNKNNLKIIISC